MFNFGIGRISKSIRKAISPTREEKVVWLAKKLAFEMTEDALYTGEKLTNKEVGTCLNELKRVVKNTLEQREKNLEQELKETIESLKNI